MLWFLCQIKEYQLITKKVTKEFQYKYLLNFTEVKFTSVNFNAPEATRGMFFQRSTYDYLKLIID